MILPAPDSCEVPAAVQAAAALEPYEVRLIARLDVKPGDVVVVTVPQPVDDDTARYMAAQLRTVLPERVAVVILDKGMDVAVLAPSQVDPAKVAEIEGARP